MNITGPFSEVSGDRIVRHSELLVLYSSFGSKERSDALCCMKYSAAYILWISMFRKGALAKSNESTTKEPPPNERDAEES